MTITDINKLGTILRNAYEKFELASTDQERATILRSLGSICQFESGKIFKQIEDQNLDFTQI